MFATAALIGVACCVQIALANPKGYSLISQHAD
jgi:hypothetical protein